MFLTFITLVTKVTLETLTLVTIYLIFQKVTKVEGYVYPWLLRLWRLSCRVRFLPGLFQRISNFYVDQIL